MRLHNFVVLLSFIILVGCTPLTAVRHSDNYSNVLQQKKNILILPQEVEVNTVSASGSKTRMYDYEYYLIDVLNEVTPSVLTDKEYKSTTLKKSIIKEKGLSDDLISLRKSYKPVLDDLYKSLLMSQKDAFVIKKNIGQSAVKIAEKTGSDLLIITDYQGNVKTNGARAKDFALDVTMAAFGISTQNSANADAAAMTIGLIDGKTGDIIWTHVSSLSKDLYSSAFSSMTSSQKEEDRARVANLLKSGLAPLPKKSEIGIVKGK